MKNFNVAVYVRTQNPPPPGPATPAPLRPPRGWLSAAAAAGLRSFTKENILYDTPSAKIIQVRTDQPLVGETWIFSESRSLANYLLHQFEARLKEGWISEGGNLVLETKDPNRGFVYQNHSEI